MSLSVIIYILQVFYHFFFKYYREEQTSRTMLFFYLSVKSKLNKLRGHKFVPQIFNKFEIFRVSRKGCMYISFPLPLGASIPTTSYFGGFYNIS